MVEELDGTVLAAVTQFGAAGLMGLLWILERRHALARERQLDEAHRRIVQRDAELGALLDVVKDNTRAMAALEQGQRQLIGLLQATAPRAPGRGAVARAAPA